MQRRVRQMHYVLTVHAVAMHMIVASETALAAVSIGPHITQIPFSNGLLALLQRPTFSRLFADTEKWFSSREPPTGICDVPPVLRAS